MKANDTLKIAFLGGFSAGKTTFISRVLGKLSGATSSFPETSTVICHKLSKFQMYSIEFNQEFKVSVDGFEAFVRKYDFEKGFEKSGNTWKKLHDDFFLKNWDLDVFINFLNEVKPFSEYISTITVHHYFSPKYPTLLRFCELYDLPGLGGDEIHDLKISNFCQRLNEFDIIFYVIDSDRGVLSECEVKFLKEIASPHFYGCERDIYFYWLYQKPSQDVQNYFVEKHKEILTDIISLFVELVDTDFYKKFISQSNILEACGDENDSDRANKAIANSIANFYYEQCSQFMDLANSNLERLKDLPPFLEFVSGKSIDIIAYFVEKLKFLSYEGNTIIALHELNPKTLHDYIYKDILFIPVAEEIKSEIHPYALTAILKMKEDISTGINKIVEKLLKSSQVFKINKKYRFNLDFIVYNLENELSIQKNSEFLIKTQMLHLFYSYHNGTLVGSYARGILQSQQDSLFSHLKIIHDELSK